MSKKELFMRSLSMGHFTWNCKLSNYAILSFLYHHVIHLYITQTHFILHTIDIYQIAKFM